MIQLTQPNGRPLLLMAAAIAYVKEAGPNDSRVGSYVRMRTGETFEVRERCEEIERRIDVEQQERGLL